MFSKSCKYGIRGVLLLAQNSDVNHKIGVRELAAFLSVPVHFLAKILQDLARKRIISSTKGPNGGFYLTDKEKQQNLMTIVDAIDGMAQFEECALGLRECSNVNPCPLHHGVKKMRDNIKKDLHDTTLSEFAVKLNNGKVRLAI
ncbi:MAG: Rrf2 family transcriptional regulator [Bacteroidetes bacterium]|nr:Rrf2 family transcriptional regulator [Bacteroidota bacterium]